MYKKISSFLVLLFLCSTLLPAQKQGVKIFGQMADMARQKIQQLEYQSELDDFTICQTYYQWDSLTNQPFKNGDGTINFESLGETKKFTIISQTEEDGEMADIKIEAYFSFQEITYFSNGVNGDSILIFAGNGLGDYALVFKDINYWENGKVVTTESFTDFSLFDPSLDFQLSGITSYRYDNSDFLIEEVNETFNVFSSEIEFSDSIVYNNNEWGLPLIETGYSANFFTGQIEATYRTTYTYVNDIYVDTQTDHVPDGNMWIPVERQDIDYDGQNRQLLLLFQSSTDGGSTWDNTRRNQFEYEEVLPLNLFTKELSEKYVNEAWRNESLTINENCTSGAFEVYEMELLSWFNGDQLNFKTELEGPVHISLFDFSGKMHFNSSFDQIPEHIDGRHLKRGIYILHFEQAGTKLVQKVFK